MSKFRLGDNVVIARSLLITHNLVEKKGVIREFLDTGVFNIRVEFNNKEEDFSYFSATELELDN